MKGESVVMDVENLRAGERITFSGTVYTARDAAHKRLVQMLDDGQPLPFPLHTLYYVGPCPAPPGRIIGSAGPTTSLRMDAYTPRLMDAGLRVMIGKGERGPAVADAIRRHKGVYLSAVGGAGALLSLCAENAEVVAFPDLGTEAVYKLTIRDMPLVVALDCHGGSIWTTHRNH